MNEQENPLAWLDKHQFSLKRDYWLGNTIIWRVVAHDGRGQIANGKTAVEAYEKARKKLEE